MEVTNLPIAVVNYRWHIRQQLTAAAFVGQIPGTLSFPFSPHLNMFHTYHFKQNFSLFFIQLQIHEYKMYEIIFNMIKIKRKK